MAIFGARGIRDSVFKTYRKHLAVFRREPSPKGISEHHAALHGALVLRYAASYNAKPEAVVWLELIPFLPLAPEAGVKALAEYVVFKERGQDADLERLREWVRQGLDGLSEDDRKTFVETAGRYHFSWLRLM